MARNSFIQISKLSNLKGRIDYITNPKRQENLYAVYNTADDSFWYELGKCNRLEFKKSGSAGSCIEARELIIALPEQFGEMDKKKILEDFTKLFKDKYGVECTSALHHNKTKTNLHIHMIFAERELLKDGDIKVASRNMFYDENGKHVRTKKEILDDEGNIRPGCTIIKKGEVYENNKFSKKKVEFKTRSFLKGAKELYTEHINSFLEDKDKLQVFSDKGIYLPTKKVGKNNPKAKEIVESNRVRQEWNSKVDEALYYDVPREHIKTIKDKKIKKGYNIIGDKFTKVNGGIKRNQSSRENVRVPIFSMMFINGVNLAIKCLEGLIDLYKAIVVPKIPFPERRFNEVDIAFDKMMDAHREYNYCDKCIEELKDRISRKDYKLIGEKKELQEIIKIFESNKKKAKSVERKMLKILGFTNVTEAEFEMGKIRLAMDEHKRKVEDSMMAERYIDEETIRYMDNLDMFSVPDDKSKEFSKR